MGRIGTGRGGGLHTDQRPESRSDSAPHRAMRHFVWCRCHESADAAGRPRGASGELWLAPATRVPRRPSRRATTCVPGH